MKADAMINRYELEITCVCPVDKQPDVYAMEVISRRTVLAEDILATVNKVSADKLYQEDLCQLLHRELNAFVRLTGFHSGIRVVSECGECPV